MVRPRTGGLGGESSGAKICDDRRSSQHGTSQRSGEWARATGRARRAAQDHPAELAYIWNLCRSRGEHRLDTKPPRAGKRESDDSAHQSAALCGMDEVVPPVPEEPFDADVSRDGHDSVLRPSFLQVFAVGNRSDSPRVSVPLSSRLGPVSSKRRGPNQKGPEGLGTLGARELKGPATVDHRACPRIGTQPARPLRDVNGDAPGHRCVSTSRSGGGFRPMGPALVPSRRRACEQNPAARRHNHTGFV